MPPKVFFCVTGTEQAYRQNNFLLRTYCGATLTFSVERMCAVVVILFFSLFLGEVQELLITSEMQALRGERRLQASAAFGHTCFSAHAVC